MKWKSNKDNTYINTSLKKGLALGIIVQEKVNNLN